MNATSHRRFAILLAVFALAGGSAIYWLWRFTRFEPLIYAGFLWIGFGVLLVLAGAFCVYRSEGRRVLPTILLLANFPLAALYTVSAMDVETRIEIRMRNESGQLIENIELRAGEWRRKLGNLEAERSRGVVLRSRPEAGIGINYTIGDTRYHRKLTDYAVSGDSIRVTFLPAGSAAIDDPRPGFAWPILP